MRGRGTYCILLFLLGLFVLSAGARSSLGQASGAGVDTVRVVSIDVDGHPLEDAVNEFIEKTRIDVAFDPELLHWKRSSCRIDAPDVEAALRCVLQGTGLTFQRLSSGGYVIVTEDRDARSSYTVSGFVQDASSGEMFAGANVYEPNRRQGTATNIYGFYSVTLPADSVTLVFSYLGYQPAERKVVLTADARIDVALQPVTLNSSEVVVSAERGEPIESRTQMSAVEVPIRQIQSIPTIMGETDLIKAFQLMPGVRSGTEGSSGLYVRGGSPDQTLVLLDGATVYNVSHFFGLFSVFNADAIRHAELIKGGFPARYGGRLSSVLDVGMKEGNMKRFGGEFAIGAVATRLMLEGPIAKDRTSFIVSGRRTYFDAIARPFMPEDEKAGVYFYDLNAKINHKLGSSDRLYLSMYRGNDRFSVETRERTEFDQYGSQIEDPTTTEESKGHLQWGNLTSTLRWNRVISDKLFSNVMAAYTNYNFDTAVTERDLIDNESYDLDYQSGIQDWLVRADFDWLPTPDHFVRTGLKAIRHTFSPGATVLQVDLDEDGEGVPIDLEPAAKVKSWEYSAFVEDDIRLSNRLKMNLGIHASAYFADGATYGSLEPRVSARYLLPTGWAVKASYARMKQYILLLTNSAVGLPTDLWLPVTSEVPPQTSHLVALGLSTSLLDNRAEFSIEGYYKSMHGLIEYKAGASFLGIDQDWQEKIEIGEGRSYGLEFLFQKKTGRTTGWLGYTLSRTDRTFENLNRGEPFPFRYDARHDISVVVTHLWKPWLELSANWVYATGNAITLPTTTYHVNPYIDNRTCFGCTVTTYDERGNYRQRAHHRMDVAVNFHKSTVRGRTQTFTIGAYNAYNRMNPFFVTWDGDDRLSQFTLFPIIPYFTYRRSF